MGKESWGRIYDCSSLVPKRFKPLQHMAGERWEIMNPTLAFSVGNSYGFISSMMEHPCNPLLFPSMALTVTWIPHSAQTAAMKKGWVKKCMGECWFYRRWMRSPKKKKKTFRVGQQKSNSCFRFLMVAVNGSRPSFIGSMPLRSCLLTEKVTKVVTASGIYWTISGGNKQLNTYEDSE